MERLHRRARHVVVTVPWLNLTLFEDPEICFNKVDTHPKSEVKNSKLFLIHREQSPGEIHRKGKKSPPLQHNHKTTTEKI